MSPVRSKHVPTQFLSISVCFNDYYISYLDKQYLVCQLFLTCMICMSTLTLKGWCQTPAAEALAPTLWIKESPAGALQSSGSEHCTWLTTALKCCHVVVFWPSVSMQFIMAIHFNVVAGPKQTVLPPQVASAAELPNLSRRRRFWCLSRCVLTCSDCGSVSLIFSRTECVQREEHWRTQVTCSFSGPDLKVTESHAERFAQSEHAPANASDVGTCLKLKSHLLRLKFASFWLMCGSLACHWLASMFQRVQPFNLPWHGLTEFSWNTLYHILHHNMKTPIESVESSLFWLEPVVAVMTHDDTFRYIIWIPSWQSILLNVQRCSAAFTLGWATRLCKERIAPGSELLWRQKSVFGVGKVIRQYGWGWTRHQRQTLIWDSVKWRQAKNLSTLQTSKLIPRNTSPIESRSIFYIITMALWPIARGCHQSPWSSRTTSHNVVPCWIPTGPKERPWNMWHLSFIPIKY